MFTFLLRHCRLRHAGSGKKAQGGTDSPSTSACIACRGMNCGPRNGLLGCVTAVFVSVRLSIARLGLCDLAFDVGKK